MKKTYISLLALVVSLCLLCGALPVSALYQWTEGQIPNGWTRPYSKGGASAVDILEPVNPNASDEAKSLLAYLSQFTDSNRILSGTFDISTDNEVYNMVKNEFGNECVIYSNRYTLNTASGSMAFTNVEKANQLRVEHYNNGNILLLHADQFQMEDIITNKAIELGVTTGATANLITHLDSTNPDRRMELYNLYMDYMNNYVAALQAMEEAGVKAYMLRFWVEFNYRNFTGSSESYYDYFIRVYQQTVDHLINSDLKGFLITFAPGAETQCETRYPGNEYVDVLSVTHYSKANMLGELENNYPLYEWYLNTGKPFGFSEFSCRSPYLEEAGLYPRPSWYTTLQNIMTYWPRTGWALGWDDSRFSLSDNRETPKDGTDDGKLLLDSPFVVTLDESKDFGDYQEDAIAPVGVAQLYYTGNASDTRIAMEECAYTAAMLAERGINLTDVRAARVCTGYSLRIYASEDCSGTPLLLLTSGYEDGYAEDVYTADGQAKQLNGSMKYVDGLVMAKAKSCEIVSLASKRLNLAAANINISSNLNKASTSPNDITAIFDGYANTGWQGQPSDNSNGYITIDLGEEYIIDTYVLSNAHCATDLGTFNGFLSSTKHPFNDEQFNTDSWNLQYSSDNSTWKTAHSVTGNTADTVNQTLNEAVTARYIKLLVTVPNTASGISTSSYRKYVTISEFELYGTRKSFVNDTADTYDAERQQSLDSLGTQLRNTVNDTGYNLRFVFDLTSTGIGYAAEDPVSSRDYSVKLDNNSMVTVDGTPYPVKEFGAVVSTDPKAELVLESTGTGKTKKVPAEKLYSELADGVRFTAVVVKIPAEHIKSMVYARPYVIYKVSGVEKVLYGTPDRDCVYQIMVDKGLLTE